MRAVRVVWAGQARGDCVCASAPPRLPPSKLSYDMEPERTAEATTGESKTPKRHRASQPSETPPLQLFVRGESSSTTCYTVASSSSVGELRRRIAARTMLPIEVFYLTMAGRVLDDALSLNEATGDQQLRDTTLHLRLRGTSSVIKGSRSATPTGSIDEVLSDCRCPSRTRSVPLSPDCPGAELQPEQKRARLAQHSADNLVPWLAGWAVQ